MTMIRIIKDSVDKNTHDNSFVAGKLFQTRNKSVCYCNC